ncbi:MAG: hypothetical protein ACRDRU_28600 [Pseudonocardiaceae bacterium]
MAALTAAVLDARHAPSGRLPMRSASVSVGTSSAVKAAKQQSPGSRVCQLLSAGLIVQVRHW